MLKQFLYLILLFVYSESCLSQNLKYTFFNNSSENLKEYFLKNKNYQNAGSNELPYFSNGNIEVKFYKTIGVIVDFKFKKRSEFNYATNEIIMYANFDFKYCIDYNSSIVYNFNTSNANEIRINSDENTIVVQHPSQLGDFLRQNRDFLPIVICTSDNSYAFHTNIKCQGFNNCNTIYKKLNIREAKIEGYKMCKICSSL